VNTVSYWFGDMYTVRTELLWAVAGRDCTCVVRRGAATELVAGGTALWRDVLRVCRGGMLRVRRGAATELVAGGTAVWRDVFRVRRGGVLNVRRGAATELVAGDGRINREPVEPPRPANADDEEADVLRRAEGAELASLPDAAIAECRTRAGSAGALSCGAVVRQIAGAAGAPRVAL
jgi:hypothetical protein